MEKCFNASLASMLLCYALETKVDGLYSNSYSTFWTVMSWVSEEKKTYKSSDPGTFDAAFVANNTPFLRNSTVFSLILITLILSDATTDVLPVGALHLPKREKGMKMDSENT